MNRLVRSLFVTTLTVCFSVALMTGPAGCAAKRCGSCTKGQSASKCKSGCTKPCCKKGKCKPGCTKPCCKKASSKCPAGCDKPCCKKVSSKSDAGCTKPCGKKADGTQKAGCAKPCGRKKT